VGNPVSGDFTQLSATTTAPFNARSELDRNLMRQSRNLRWGETEKANRITKKRDPPVLRTRPPTDATDAEGGRGSQE